MDERVLTCVELLAEQIEENEEGGWKYSGEGSKLYDYLMPILIDNLDINPAGLLVSEKRLQGDVNNLILRVRDEDDSAEAFEAQFDEVIDRINNLDVEEYEIAFPLNFQRNQRDLLPDELLHREKTFERIGIGEWRKEWVPDYKNHEGDHKLFNLNQFLTKSPNEIDDSRYIFWKISQYARDEHFAVNHISAALETILGKINFAAHYNRTERFHSHSGPWPYRLAELRSPFIFLVYQDKGYQGHYFPDGDASYRDPDGPHSMYEDLFEHVWDILPDFQENEQLDTRLIRSFDMFQAGITNPRYEEGFFEFWRGLEILVSIGDSPSKTDEDDAMAGIVERVRRLFRWENPEIADLRLERISDKRNAYVHEGYDVTIERIDYNLSKTLLEGLIDLACERRLEWNVGDWKYFINNVETDEEILKQKQSVLGRRIHLLEQMKEFEWG